jgi:hypothetical protein
MGVYGLATQTVFMHNRDPRRSFPFPSQRIYSIVQETFRKPGKVAGLQLPFQQGRVGQKTFSTTLHLLVVLL